jgi:hypothetical protein
LAAAVVRRAATYEWCDSLDPTRESLVPEGEVAKTTRESLMAEATAHVRTRALRCTGKGDGSDPFAVLVT